MTKSVTPQRSDLNFHILRVLSICLANLFEPTTTAEGGGPDYLTILHMAKLLASYCCDVPLLEKSVKNV